MNILIVIFGVLVLVAGIAIIINPKRMLSLLYENHQKLGLYVAAVVVRLLLGVLLVSQSGFSRFPFVIEIIGWLSIVAAIFLVAIGRSRFKRLMSWALTLAKPVSRVGGAFAILFGGFLVYAFV